MKIYSWNVLCYNSRYSEIRDYLANLDFDVICLQEVMPELLDMLKELPYEIAYHTDVIRLFPPKKSIENFVVILSKHPITHIGTLQFADFKLPVHTRVFISFMSLFGWSYVTNRGAVYADIITPQKALRVFSVHLTLWGPHNRKKEFEIVSAHLPKGMPVVVAGDFNIIEFGPMKILNWLLGAPLSHALPWYPERAHMEELFKAQRLQNPLYGLITHDISRSQLDHILVSDGLSVTEKHVVADAHGSDHHPVSVTINLDA